MTERLSKSPIVFSREVDGVLRNSERVKLSDWMAERKAFELSQPRELAPQQPKE